MSVTPLHRRHGRRASRQSQVSDDWTMVGARRYFASLTLRVQGLLRQGLTNEALRELSDHQLRDIGINRTDVRSLVNERHNERARGYVDWRRHDPRF